MISRRSTAASPDVSGVSTGGRVWLIRAGREGRYEELAIAEGGCLIGWSDLGEIPPEMTRDELKDRISEIWDERRAQSLASQAGQMYRFVHEVQTGDLVVLPLKSRPGLVAVGRITGDYAYRAADGPFEDADAGGGRRS